jgi:hypothetical protein
MALPNKREAAATDRSLALLVNEMKNPALIELKAATAHRERVQRMLVDVFAPFAGTLPAITGGAVRADGARTPSESESDAGPRVLAFGKHRLFRSL